MMLGMAIRMATDLNLHRKSVPCDIDTEEGRARDLEVSPSFWSFIGKMLTPRSSIENVPGSTVSSWTGPSLPKWANPTLSEKTISSGKRAKGSGTINDSRCRVINP